MKKKCHKCGTVDSLHKKNEGISKLVGDMGPLDTDGLMMFYVYCRNCQTINIYKPGWFGNTKFSRIVDMPKLLDQITQGNVEEGKLKEIFGDKITKALKADNLLD